MQRSIIPSLLVLLFASGLSCQQQSQDEKTIASTHPKLEEQLERGDSISTPITNNENPDLYQRYRINVEDYLSDGTYKVQEVYQGRLAPLDANSHTDARNYRSALQSGLKEGVNFAGKYTVVNIGCGTACQTHYIVDRENGKVIDKVQSSMGARFNTDSRLLIVNPPDSTVNYNECNNCTPVAYVLENNRLQKLEKQAQ